MENSRLGNEGSKVTQNTISIIAQFFYFNFFVCLESSCLSRFYKNVLKNPILIRWSSLSKRFFLHVVFSVCLFVVVFTNNAGCPLLHCCLLIYQLSHHICDHNLNQLCFIYHLVKCYFSWPWLVI